jgi:hypothetical protein
VAAVLAVLATGTVIEMAVLGFFTPHGRGQGFNCFSMNLLAPVFPPSTSLVGWFGDLDATGGQYEGLNFLGLGLLALIPAALWAEKGRLAEIARRYRGVLVVAALLAAFSLSNWIYLGNRLFLLFPSPPRFLTDFRAPGRFFWPVSYLLLVSAVVAVARRGRRFDGILAVAALLQWSDAAGMRAVQRSILDRRPAPVLAGSSWLPAMRAHARIVVAPSWACATPHEIRAVEEAVYLASIPRAEISTFHDGRPSSPDCAKESANFPEAAGAKDTLSIVLDARPLPSNGAAKCVAFPGGKACSTRSDAAEVLKPIGNPLF